MKRPVVLSIAGSDPGGGAGIQQDLKVLTVLKVYGCTAITALTVQNTMGVQAVYPVAGSILRDQILAVVEDISPPVVKIGMLSTRENVEAAAAALYGREDCFIVADPVMLSKNGRALLDEDAVCSYRDKLFPIIDLITPNIPECARLTGVSSQEPEFSEKAMIKLFSLMAEARPSGRRSPAILLKGGHDTSAATCTDILYMDGRFHLYESRRLMNPHTHGTGCTLSSAIAAFIARGEAVVKAVEKARNFVFEAIRGGFPLGRGTGPVDPMVFLK